MTTKNAPDRGQRREEKMQGASLLAHGSSLVNGPTDTTTAAQRARLLDALRRGSLTTLEARHNLDVMHPAARVMELRKQGHTIVTVWTTDLTPEGSPHRVARYFLRQNEVAHG